MTKMIDDGIIPYTLVFVREGNYTTVPIAADHWRCMLVFRQFISLPQLQASTTLAL